MTLTPAQQALLAVRLRGRRPAAAQDVPAGIPPAPDGPAPVSAEQEQLLLHGIFAAGDPLYNEGGTVERTGPLDVAALQRALDGVVARHGMWRSTFRRIERRWRQVVGEPTGLPIEVVDRPADEAALVEDLVLRPYDLRTGPLLRALLVHAGDDVHRLHLAMHHLAFDGRSLSSVVFPELVALYAAEVAGRPADLPAPVQYADYATWRADGRADADLARHLPWWRDYLDGAPTLDLPLDHPRPAEPGHRGTATWFTVPAATAAALQARGVAAGASLVQVLIAAYGLLLARRSGAGEVVVATVADLRRRRELESMLGYCLTPIPLRVRASDDLDTVIAAVRGDLLDALEHAVPFGPLVAALDPPRRPGTAPVFQTMLVLQPSAASPYPGWELLRLDPTLGRIGHAKSEIMLELDERLDGEIVGRVVHNATLWDDGFGAGLAAEWTALLDEVSRDRTPARP